MSIKYVNVVIFGVNALLALVFAIQKGKGWWSAFLGWSVAVVCQVQIIMAG